MQMYTAAVCQMNSQDDKEENLRTAGRLIDEAASGGARLIVLPETMNYIGRNQSRAAEILPSPACADGSTPDAAPKESAGTCGETFRFLSERAARHGVWLIGGSIPERTKNAKPKNTMMLIGPDGRLKAKYSKLHMFDVEIEGGTSCCESAANTPGKTIVTADTPLGVLGMAICYDIRFPEMFRLMALAGAQVICVSACFTEKTVRDHWEILLRARAIENGVYILASNQIGEKPAMTAGGHSMIIDPWGCVIAQAGGEPGCIYAQIDSDYIASVRRQIPSLRNRREDVYRLDGCVRS